MVASCAGMRGDTGTLVMTVCLQICKKTGNGLVTNVVYYGRTIIFGIVQFGGPLIIISGYGILNMSQRNLHVSTIDGN